MRHASPLFTCLREEKGSPSISVSGTPVRKSGSAQQLFKKLFVSDSEAAKKALQLEVEEQGSVLDLIREQATSLGKKVNNATKTNSMSI